MITPEKLAAFAPDDYAGADMAQVHIDTATALVEGYTRGNHTTPAGVPRPGVESVILTVAARLMANPGQVTRRDQAGSFSTHRGAGFSGFTLAEQAVLNRYRKRAV